MCKFRVSIGLVLIALAVALLCNVYLVFLLWSGGQNNEEYHYDLTPLPITVQPEAPINLVNSVSLNLIYLKSILNTSKLVSRSRSKSLISMINKLKRELQPRGEETSIVISSSAKVINY